MNEGIYELINIYMNEWLNAYILKYNMRSVKTNVCHY